MCLERRFSKQNSVIRLKSNVLPLPQFLAGYAIGSLEKDIDRMCPSSPRQTWSSNLNQTASQLFQIASPRADQRRLMWIARKRLGSPSQVSSWSVSSWSIIWNHCLNSRNNSVILSLYWFKSTFSPVVRILFRQRKRTVSSSESFVFHKDNFILNATYGVVILSDKSFAALQHFVQIIQVLRNIHHKGKVLHFYCEMKF